jgi:type II secretory pathway pseudopilin PulG
MKTPLLSAEPFRQILCLILAVSLATGPSTAALAQTDAAAQAVRQRVQGLDSRGEREPAPVAPPPRAERPTENQPTDASIEKTDTTYVASDAVAIAVIRPAQLLAAPIAQMLPIEVASAAGLKYLGFDPADVDEVVAFAQMPAGETPELGYGITIKFNKPFKGSAIPANLRAHAATGELAGRKYLQSPKPMLPSFFAPDSKTLVVAPDTTLRQIVEAKDQDKSGPVIDRVLAAPAGSDLYAAVDMAAIRPLMAIGLLQAAQQMPPGTPPEVQQFFEAPNLISAAELTLNFSTSGPVALVVHANDDAAAEKLESMVDTGMKLYQGQLQAQMAAQAASGDSIQQALAQYTERMSGQWASTFRPTREGAALTFFKTDGEAGAQQQLTQVAIIGILVALLLPAVQAAREAARRNQSINGLKQLMLALHIYHDVRKAFPAHASYSPDGKPLLSWRVHILPFVEEEALYKEFHLDEPWDSDHNRKLIARMPQVYQNPNLPLEPGKTNYLAVVGKECIFDGTEKGLGFAQISDGTSKTIALVEANADRAVEWTKPDDWKYNADQPNAGVGGLRPGGWNAAFADGSVRFIANDVDLETLKALFTRAGREVTDAEGF